VREARTLARDVEATVIPYGDRTTLTEGSTVYLTQSLGGSYTVMTERGYMVRVEGEDADAIGETSLAESAAGADLDRPLDQRVWDQLRTCYDPEIPINIVELGLVYLCEVTPREQGDHKVKVHFTLTSPACPLWGVLQEDIKRKVLSVAGVGEVEAEVVFDPPWSAAMMSDAARLQLGLM
jgi:probable FeS assembly SUF system protein SufT